MFDNSLDDTKSEYNKFTEFPNIAYNCVSYLIDSNELLWKLFYYNDPDAWKSTKANLTKKQKADLIYDGKKKETDCRVFFDSGQDDSWLSEVCLMRIFPLELYPTNHVYGNISIGIEVYSHFKINTLSNYQTRVDLATQQIISTFNGQMVGGLGRMYFDDYYTSGMKVFTLGKTPYKGKGIILCNYIAG